MPPRICNNCDKVNWKSCSCKKNSSKYYLKKLLTNKLNFLNFFDKENIKEIEKLESILELIKLNY
jgi:hypothetical protein